MWKVIQVIRFNAYNRPRFLPLSGGLFFFMLDMMSEEMEIAKVIIDKGYFYLACMIYTEDWVKIRTEYGNVGLDKIRSEYRKRGNSNKVSEIMKYL